MGIELILKEITKLDRKVLNRVKYKLCANIGECYAECEKLKSELSLVKIQNNQCLYEMKIRCEERLDYITAMITILENWESELTEPILAEDIRALDVLEKIEKFEEELTLKIVDRNYFYLRDYKIRCSELKDSIMDIPLNSTKISQTIRELCKERLKVCIKRLSTLSTCDCIM